jgi:DNA-binding transcriptional ArsR family regulator
VLTVGTRLDAMTRLGRAVADPTRCRLLLALLDGPAYPGQLADTLGLTRPNVSNHLTCLRGCGLVVATPEGRQVRYELADRHLAAALTDLLEAVRTVDPDRSGPPAADSRRAGADRR